MLWRIAKQARPRSVGKELNAAFPTQSRSTSMYLRVWNCFFGGGAVLSENGEMGGIIVYYSDD